MPQFDFATFPGQIFWLLVAFALQYLVMMKLIVPGLKAIFHRRCSYVERQIALAEQYTERSEKIHLEYEQKIAKAKEESMKAINAASAKIHKEAELALLKLQNNLLSQLHQRELKSKKDAASNKEMKDMALNLAIELTSKLTKAKISKKALIKYI